tara:strand:+ start:509 stop:2020 length:1512 start_codon:yes stop_codon:yes gene_type:complete
MPLINIQTNLKDLKYGDFGSEAPFVTKNINNPPQNNDGLSIQAQSRIDDLRRFGKFLISGNGVNWAAKQGTLNVLEETLKANSKKSLVGKFLSGGWSTAKLIASTTAQIPVNGTGTHFVEGFAGKRGYLEGVQGHVLSRQGSIINLSPGSTGGLENAKDPNPASGQKSRVLSRYLFNPPGEKNKQNLIQKLFNAPDLPDPDKLEYRTNIFDTGSKTAYNSEPGSGISIATHTVTTANSEKFQRNKQGLTAVDSINARFPIKAAYKELETKEFEDKLKKELGTTKDLCNFVIKIIKPRASTDGPSVEILNFRAFLDSLSDNYSGDWESSKYIGRAEELYNYSGFSRDIQFGFKLAAQSAQEMRPMYLKLNRLAGSTAPTYLNSTYMRGTFVELTIGDYFRDLPGFIGGVDIQWSTDYQWSQDGDEAEVGELPTILDVSVNFTPIHRTAPNADQIFIGDPATIRQKVDLDGPPPEVQEDSSETADVSSGVGTVADPNSESPNTFY